jgi:hypothetical protein
VRTTMTRLAVLAALSLAAGPGRAQDAAPGPVEDPRAPKFADVERGFFVGLEAGWPVVLEKTPTKDPVKFPQAADGGGRALGLAVGLQLGYDLTNRLALSLFADGYFLEANASYGAFDVMAAGLDARYAFIGRKDRNGWERFLVYVHARGGYVLTHPEGLFGDTDLLVGGGVGVEYFAQLRHFSWWAQVDGLYVLDAASPGGALLTGVRYTF